MELHASQQRALKLRVLLLLTFLSPAVAARGQLPTADLTRMVPRAARAGESVEVNLVGQNLDELTELRFTHPGITAASVMLPADEFHPEPRRHASRFTVTVSEDVPPGIYEARAVGYFGYSTARPFVVAPKDSAEVSCDGKNTDRTTALPVEFNSVVTGDVPSRGIHWFRFHAQAGQRVLVEVTSERIDSRLDSQLILFDAHGKELARNRDTYGRDAFMEVQPKQESDYLVALSDILYRGGGEHFYRLSISTRPHIDFIWPPAAVPGSTQQYTVYGRNLLGSRVNDDLTLNGFALESVPATITLPQQRTIPAGHFPGQPRQGLLPGVRFQYKDSNAVRVGFATSPVVLEDPALPVQVCEVPCEIAGRFDTADDEDSFRFHATAGQTVFIEAIADRMGSPVDPFLIVEHVLKSDDGTEVLNQVAENDDMPSLYRVDGKDSINPDTNDAAVRFTAESDGEYQVTLVNQFGDGGTRHLYRLAIREQTPDFQILATTERPLPTNRTGYSVTPHLRRNARWGISIMCPRQDDFDGDITITAEDLPDGVTARPLVLSNKTDRGVLIVSAAQETPAWSGDIRIVGRASTNGRELVREAKFASLVWGHIFADSIRVRSRITERVPLSVNGYEDAPVIIQPAEDRPWVVEVGSKLDIPIKLIDNGSRVGNLTIEPCGLFGMHRSPPTVNIAENATEGTLSINFTKNGNFAVETGRYQFALLGTGVTKYCRNERGLALAQAEESRLAQLLQQVSAESAAAKTAADKAKADADAAVQKAKEATDEPSRTTLKAAADSAKAAFEQAQAAAKSAAERVKTVRRLRTEVDKLVKSEESKSAPKDTKFAAWSELITVEVRPAATKP